MHKQIAGFKICLIIIFFLFLILYDFLSLLYFRKLSPNITIHLRLKHVQNKINVACQYIFQINPSSKK